MTYESLAQNIQEAKPYPISFEGAHFDLKNDIAPEKTKTSGTMLVRCRSCGKEFDTTFTVDDFAKLPLDQRESGTLHICPYCGVLSLYLIKDYFEDHSKK